MSKIKVMVSDDSEYIAEYFSSLINSSDECECVGTAKNEAETMEKIVMLRPDVILLDIQMDYKDSGLKLIPKLRMLFQDLKIIIISIHDEKDLVFEAIRLGAYDYIVKNQMPDEIIESIKNAYAGKKIMRGDIAQLVLDECKTIEKRQVSLIYMFNSLLSLSEREIDVLKALCDGKKYSEIAKSHQVEEVTIRTQVSRIIKKLNYPNVDDLVQHIREIKIFDLFKKME